MTDSRYRYTQNAQSANASSSTMFGYIPPAKGLPYGMIEQVAAPAQNRPNPGATAITGSLAPQPMPRAAMSAPPVAHHPLENGTLWGRLNNGVGQAVHAVQEFTGIPPRKPLPPGAPALPGDPYSNPKRHQVTGTHMGLNGEIVRSYSPEYNQYDPVSRQGFEVHEGDHAEKLLREYPHNAWGTLTSWFDSRVHPEAWEIPAYQKQIDFYQDYLMTHPYDTPGWDKVLKTQDQMYKALESYSKK